MVESIEIRKISLITVILFLFGSIHTHTAFANGVIFCKVYTIEASNNAAGVDNNLKDYLSIFAQKPFTEFKSFELISEKEYKLVPNKPLQLTLPTQLSGTLEYKGMTGNSLNLNLKLSKQGSTPIIIEGKTGNGVPFIAAGLKSPKGRWVLAVKCKH